VKKTEKNLGPQVSQFDYRDSVKKNVDLDIKLPQKKRAVWEVIQKNHPRNEYMDGFRLKAQG